MTYNFDKMTNTEFLNWMMEYSKSGGMMQVFVVQAIEYYSKLIVDSDLNWPKDHIISEEYWKRTAREAQYLMQLKYGGKNEAVQNMQGEETDEGAGGDVGSPMDKGENKV